LRPNEGKGIKVRREWAVRGKKKNKKRRQKKKRKGREKGLELPPQAQEGPREKKRLGIGEKKGGYNKAQRTTKGSPNLNAQEGGERSPIPGSTSGKAEEPVPRNRQHPSWKKGGCPFSQEMHGERCQNAPKRPGGKGRGEGLGNVGDGK